MTRPRGLVLGIVIVTIGVVVATVVATRHHRHPAPKPAPVVATSAYHFLDPPPQFAAGNVPPEETAAVTIALGAGGSVPTHFGTSDGQFAVSLAAGAIAPAAGATSVTVQITPLVPRHLRPLPRGLRANGNAYQVDMKYEPSGVAVTRLAKAGVLKFEIPEPGPSLFVSPDATAWSLLPTRSLPPHELILSTRFSGAGYYLAGTR